MTNVTPISEAPKLTKAERLDLYCQGLCDGLSRKNAYVERAQYADGPYALRNANHFHKANLTYINAFISEHIGSHAPTALKVILRIMNDECEKGGIRLKAAQDVLDRAGFSAKQKIEVTTPDVRDMSSEDIKNELKRAFEESPELAEVFNLRPKQGGSTS